LSDANKNSEKSPGRGHAQVCIAPLAPEDAEAVAALAAKIWWPHYSGIISAAQIEYMLSQRYDPRVVRAELERDDVWWDKLLVGAKIAGFASCFLIAKAAEMKLDKLYVHPDYQRKGYGGMVIAHVGERARVQGCSRLTLAVNKRNGIAISAYRKHGFQVRAAVEKDIGGGFVMDDYIMEKVLKESGE
jgi:GNAT superfamily N-acetyltransferase